MALAHGIRLELDVYCRGHSVGDEASGAAAGLLHPLSTKGKLMWHGADAWHAATRLVHKMNASAVNYGRGSIMWKTGTIRLATTASQARQLESAAKKGYPELGHFRVGFVGPDDLVQTLPGLTSDHFGALLLHDSLSIDIPRYLEVLWSATSAVVNQSGGRATLHLGVDLRSLEAVRDATSVSSGPGENRPQTRNIALCLGAGFSTFSWGDRPVRVPVDLVDGTSLALAPGTSADRQRAPSIAATPYIASQGPGRCVVGATWFRPADPERHTGAGPKTEEDLLSAARALWTPLRSWDVMGRASGTRAVPPRTHEGTTPYAGRVDAILEDNIWIAGGLGSRGVLYHAWLGELVARGLLRRSETHLPRALLRWKNDAWVPA